MSGSVITDTTLTTAVYEMDRAVSPPALCQNIGRHSPDSKPESSDQQPSRQIDQGCLLLRTCHRQDNHLIPKPTANAFGPVKIRPKSDILRPIPNENMIYARERGRITSMMMLDSFPDSLQPLERRHRRKNCYCQQTRNQHPERPIHVNCKIPSTYRTCVIQRIIVQLCQSTTIFNDFRR